MRRLATGIGAALLLVPVAPGEERPAATPVAKDQVIETLPPSVRVNQERFTTCDGCGRVYWAGSHWRRMQASLSESAGAKSESSQSE